MSTPLISIITSTYNSAGTVEKCLESVASQTFSGVEHIVIDGASVDATVDILSRNADKLSYWISEPDSGIYDAWNKAIPHVRGDWVLFLGSDDYLYDPEALARIVPALETAYPAYRVVYGKLARVSEDGTELNRMGESWEMMKQRYDYPTRKFTPHIATFHHYSMFNGSETFDRSYKYSADTRFLGEELLKHDPLFVDSLVSCQTMGGVTSVVDTVLGRWYEKYRITRELKIPVPVSKKLKSFFKALAKWSIVKVVGASRYRSVSRSIRGEGKGRPAGKSGSGSRS